MNSKKKIFFLLLFLIFAQTVYSMEKEEKEKGENILCTMPRYVLGHIASFLPSWNDIIRASSTCKDMRNRFKNPTKIIHLHGNLHAIEEKIKCIEPQNQLLPNKFALSIYDGQMKDSDENCNPIDFLAKTEEQAKRILELEIDLPNYSSNIHETIAKLTTLEVLCFPDVLFTVNEETLEAISKCISLKVLHLETKNIKNIPEKISKLTALEVLNLKNNVNLNQQAITNICKCSSLKNLNLEGVALGNLPQEIEQLKNLEVLSLTEATLMPGRIEIIRQALPKTTIIFSEQHRFEGWQ